MNHLEFSNLLASVATKWPSAPPWPDATVADLQSELAPYTFISASKALGSLYRGDKAKGFRPSPSTIAAAVRDFGELDPAWQARALPGGCEHLDSHVDAVLVTPTKPYVPGTVPEDERAEFEAAVHRPTVLGGELRCHRCGRVELCLCGPCGSVRSAAAHQPGGGSS